jgi:hypothetical protein
MLAGHEESLLCKSIECQKGGTLSAMTFFIVIPYLILLIGLVMYLPSWKNPKVGQMGWFITRIGFIAVSIMLLTGHGHALPWARLP